MCSVGAGEQFLEEEGLLVPIGPLMVQPPVRDIMDYDCQSLGTFVMFLYASSTIKVLKIMFYNWVGIKVSVIQTGFLIIYSLFVYLFVSSDCKRN